MKRTAHRILVLSILAGFAFALTSSGAGAQVATLTDYVADAVEGLRTGSVYVHPDASSLSGRQANNLRDQVADSNAGPVYIVVLPEQARQQAGGSTSDLLRQVVNGLRRDGTYALVAGTELRAGHTQVQGLVPQLATEAVEANPGGTTAAVLEDFVGRLASAARSEDGLSGSSGGQTSAAPLLGFLALGGGAVAYAVSRRRKKQAAMDGKRLAEVKAVALEDLVALGEDLRALDLQVEMPSADPRAKQEYVKALSEYETATRDLDKAQRLQDIQRVSEDIAEGRYAIACAEARLEGKELPKFREPCFFDPRHGQSVAEVDWDPGDASIRPRKVPVCAADARLLEQGSHPKSREITVGGRRMPYYDAPAYYGPWAGGYFGGGGLFQGMLIGSMFGGGWGGGFTGTGIGDGGGDSGGDFGGFGGGGFGGGGDFGGGGFGGGDFGGGDFGN
ncbi:MAG: hypothetical protein ACT4OM_07105 [Actinomycetota bacterium]